MKTLGIIPARYASSRLPGKPLVDIAGMSMIERVYGQCLQCGSLSTLLVATDDERIYNAVKDFGGEVVMTAPSHPSGTDRCWEAYQLLNKEHELIVNIQGDEPFIHPAQINELIELIRQPQTQIATLVRNISEEALKNVNTVKAVLSETGKVISFSRQVPANEANVYQHIGLYAYKTEVLKEIVQLFPTPNEMNQSLEQLRWMDNEYSIHAATTEYPNISVDTEEDLERAREYAAEFLPS